MRRVVTGGTGTALASTPGDPACKTGTAEFGSGNPPPTHAWFICFRGDLAISVLVERGRSGGQRLRGADRGALLPAATTRRGSDPTRMEDETIEAGINASPGGVPVL